MKLVEAPKQPPVGPSPPLNLPVGSVRALVTLAVLATVWTQALRGRSGGEVMNDTLLLVLGGYFGARGAQVRAASEPDGRRSQPLYLPRGSIRTLIVLGFLGVAVYLFRDGRLIGPHGPPPILVLVATFLFGTIIKLVLRGARRALGDELLSTFGHALALVTLTIVASYCVAVVGGFETSAPFQALFLGVVGFYLGER